MGSEAKWDGQQATAAQYLEQVAKTYFVSLENRILAQRDLKRSTKLKHKAKLHKHSRESSKPVHLEHIDSTKDTKKRSLRVVKQRSLRNPFDPKLISSSLEGALYDLRSINLGKSISLGGNFGSLTSDRGLKYLQKEKETGQLIKPSSTIVKEKSLHNAKEKEKRNKSMISTSHRYGPLQWGSTRFGEKNGLHLTALQEEASEGNGSNSKAEPDTICRSLLHSPRKKQQQQARPKKTPGNFGRGDRFSATFNNYISSNESPGPMYKPNVTLTSPQKGAYVIRPLNTKFPPSSSTRNLFGIP